MSRGTLTSSARFRKPKSQGLSIWPKPMQSVTGFVGSVSAGPPASASPSLISSHRASCRQSSWCSSYMYTCIHVYIYIYIYIYIYTDIHIHIHILGGGHALPEATLGEAVFVQGLDQPVAS